MSAALTLSQIVVYPVKSLAGNVLQSAEIVETGFRHDRVWMVVDERGHFITQREHPMMARVTAEPTDGALVLSVPGKKPASIPIADNGASSTGTVWASTCDTVDQGDAAAGLLTDFLGLPCRLVRMAPEFRREINPKYQPESPVSLSFTDSMPFLLIGEASLDDLNSRLQTPIPMDRFRPNLVVGGGSAFQEDAWKRIRIGSVPFRVAKDCIRCQMPTIDQQSGIKGVEPMETLGTYRASPKGIIFGRHLVHEGGGTLRAGDRVEVVE